MNAERLLQYYEQIADAPDAIARLRRFILDLAVRGKLVPQDANDEPASELLKRIAKERAERISRGEMRRGKQSANPVDFPFEPPTGWVWLSLGETGNISSGNSINEPTREQLSRVEEGRPFIATKDVGYGLDRIVYENGLLVEFSDERFRIAQKNSVLICAEGGSAGKKIGLADREICFGNKLLANETWSVIAPKFVLFVYMSEFFYQQFASKMKGVIGGISIANFLELPFPLPPLAEQHRIVAKVDELMGLCDRLEAARAGREATRDRLAAASLARLNAPDPETFQEDARFALDALPVLTTRPDQIKRLRQTILNLAVRGRLVPQDTTDEPASELLKRIAKEKARLVKGGEIKKEKPLDPITIENQPFDLPQNWSWVRLDSLSRVITKGSSPKWQGVNYVNADEGILFITSENVGNHDLRKLDDLKYVESRFRDIEPRSMLKRGDILMNLVGASIGRTAIYDLDLEANINQAVALVRLVDISDGPVVRYLLQYFNSPTAIGFMLSSRVITAQPNMSLTDAREFPIPLPPLAEQHRIVAKVDALMTLCDRLEASLTGTATTSRRLLDALLAEALVPVDAG